jgi:hypothetical protein
MGSIRETNIPRRLEGAPKSQGKAKAPMPWRFTGETARHFHGGAERMDLKPQRVLQGVAGALMLFAIVAGAQTPTAPAPATPPDTTTAPVAAAAPAAAPVWSVGTIDFSGYIDGYFSYNNNRPQNMLNDFYNFDDQDNFSLEAAKLTLNHDPDPIGAHVDLLFGRTNTLFQSSGLGINYIEQAYISIKPPKAKGFELDAGQFVTSAGDEVAETMSNWSYSHGLLFSYAIPYYHFGVRTSMPVSKVWTVGAQVVNGWNNVTAYNGGVTVGLTSALVKPKYTWNFNYYTGPSNSGLPPQYAGTQNGYRNLFDTTLLLTPNAKFNAYVNYDYGQNRIPGYTYNSDGIVTVKSMDPHWQGVAGSARQQITPNAAIIFRYEYFYDNQAFATGLDYTTYSGSAAADYLYQSTFKKLSMEECTATYEYKWVAGLLVRVEYRIDWSNKNIFRYGNDGNYDLSGRPGYNSNNYTAGGPSKDAQNTATVGLIAFFGPKR